MYNLGNRPMLVLSYKCCKYKPYEKLYNNDINIFFWDICLLLKYYNFLINVQLDLPTAIVLAYRSIRVHIIIVLNFANKLDQENWKPGEGLKCK